MPPSLPPGDSPELHLVVATPEEIIAQQNANSDEWRGVLPLTAYLLREEILAAARKLDAGVKVHAREKASISSLRWYGEGSGEDVKWVCNEKFGWC